MKCINCNSEVADGMQFCPYCGNPMVSQQPLQGQYQQPQQGQYQQRHNTPKNKLSKYIFYTVIGFIALLVIATCDGCDYATDESEINSTKKIDNIDISSINTDIIELRLASKYSLENVKITEIKQIGTSPLKLLFHFDYDSVLGRQRNFTGICTLYDDGEIDELYVASNNLVPSR